MTTPTVTTDEDTRELADLNAAAKAMSRRGKAGTSSVDYAVTHDRINAVLGKLLARG